MRNVNIAFLCIISLLACREDEKEILYFDNGSIMFEVPIKNGKREGKSIQYYLNGKIETVSNWEGGLKEGKSTDYFQNGQINKVTNFQKGKGNGECLWYDSLGVLREVFTLKNHLREGEGFLYYPSGKIFEIGFFKNDTLIYRKLLDEEGVVYAGFLPVSIKELKNREIEIRLDYTEYDSARIGIIIGNLDEKNHLKDTIEILGSSGLSQKYKLDKGNNRVTGVLFEIKMPEGDIIGRNHFDYTLDE